MGVDIRKPLKEFAHHFLEARERHATEGDTVALLCKFFEDVLGYDPIADIGHELKVKGNKRVDLTLKVDTVVRHLVEAKAANEKLRDNHIDQAYGYASQNNFNWMILTNGVDWNLYHLTIDDGVNYEIAFKVSIAPETLDDAAEKLALLHKKAVKKDELEEWWERYSAIRPVSIGKALFQECVLKLLRTEVHRETGLLFHCEDLANALHEMLSQDARDEIGPLKIHHHRASAKRAISRDQAASDGPAAVTTPVASKGVAPGGAER